MPFCIPFVVDSIELMQRTLVIMRHAQAASNWHTVDIERPLTELGTQQAQRLGALLAGEGLSFDALYVSAAQRTQETSEGLQRFITAERVCIREDLYLPTLRSINDLTYELDEETCVGVLIHEPTVSEVGEYYAKDAASLSWGVDVATALILTWEGQWTDLKRGSADLNILCGSE